MRMIEIEALQSGAHRNQAYHGVLPYGWAIVPDGMDMPNYPFGVVEADLVNDVMTVTGWTPGIIPEPEPISEPEDTEAIVMETMIDHELRLSALELGL